ncbi:MAG: hypothetical protein A3H49_06015 [Nitrospirae bacterium RIFCSPLOWO2_02_FULL_62_14]|nr:MAG: hypothetical protein A3H49_06015 [Nitrospirae bacterium RIFCSPLOWO2_02_FULL_62_14]
MVKIWIAIFVSMIWLGAVGCAEQKAAPAPSQRQVQSDSDRFFDKMKQDEQEHGTGRELGK